MKKLRIRWERLAPVGLDGRREALWIAGGLGASVLWATGPLFRLLKAWRRLRFDPIGGYRIERFMDYFSDIMGSGLAGFPVMWLCLAALAVWHYAYHRQGSRADYTMRRISSRWEFHRRCLTIPVVGIVLALALAWGLYQLYWWMYLTFTPPECLRDVAIMTVKTIR